MHGSVRAIVLALLMAFAGLPAPPAPAEVLRPGTPSPETLRVVVDISDQRMVVLWDHHPIHDWPVSTARAGKWTPRGTFTPQVLVRMHYSTIYDNAPMPWSIFFRGNYAIHGTEQVSRLGTPASAGCIRLAPENARVLFRAVQAVGKGNVTIVVKE